MAKFNVDAARKAGYSDREIENFVRKNDLEIKSSLGGFGTSVLRSAGNLIKDTGNALLHPFQTAKALGTVAAGGVSKFIPGRQQSENAFDALTDYYGTRYGIKSALKGDFGQAAQDIGRTAYFDPTGTLLDVAGLASGVGAGAKVAGKLGGSSRLAGLGDDALRFANRIDPIYQAGRGIGKGVSGIANKLDDFSKRYVTAGLGNPQTLGGVKNLRTSTGKPMNAADLFNKYPELMTRDAEIARNLKSRLGGQYSNIIESGSSFAKSDDIIDVISQFNDEIRKAKKTARINPRDVQTQNYITQLTNQRDNFINQVARNWTPDAQVPLKPIRDYRRSVTGTPSKLNSPNLQGSALADEFARKQSRGLINRSDPRLEALGLDRAALGDNRRGIIKVLEGAANRGEAAKPITLGSLGAGGFGFGAGSLAGGIPGAIAGSVVAPMAKNFLNSPRGVQTVSGATRLAGKGINKAVSASARPATLGYQSFIRPGANTNRSLRQQQVPQQSQTNQRVLPRRSPTYSTNSTPQNFNIKLFTKRNTR